MLGYNDPSGPLCYLDEEDGATYREAVILAKRGLGPMNLLARVSRFDFYLSGYQNVLENGMENLQVQRLPRDSFFRVKPPALIYIPKMELRVYYIGLSRVDLVIAKTNRFGSQELGIIAQYVVCIYKKIYI